MTTQEPKKRKRNKRGSVDEFVDAKKAKATVADERFEGQGLREEDGLLKCDPCNKYVRFKEVADVEQHCFGKKGAAAHAAFSKLSEEPKLKLKHYQKLAWSIEAARKKDVMKEAVIGYQKEVLERHEGLAAAKGSTMAKDVLADRAIVLMDLFASGIPVSKVSSARFERLIEQPHEKLAGVGGLKEAQPVVWRKVLADVKASVKDRRVSIVFDGSKVNFLIEGVLARFLDDDFMPHTLCIGAQGVTKSMDNVMMRELLRKHIADAEIEVKNIVGFLSDSGSPIPLQ
jgi:hypothetical protein